MPTCLKLCVPSKALCGDPDPKKCPELWGVFNYHPNRSSGECGVHNGTWCLDGKDQMASPENTYYALCADPIGEPCYLSARTGAFYVMMR